MSMLGTGVCYSAVGRRKETQWSVGGKKLFSSSAYRGMPRGEKGGFGAQLLSPLQLTWLCRLT